MNIDNWLIKDGTNPIYYGYARAGANTGETSWLILKETTAGDTLTREWANNDYLYNKIWADREAYYVAPVAPTLNYSAVTYVNSIAQIRADWLYSSGTTNYNLELIDASGVTVWNNKRVELTDDLRIVATLDAESNSTYTVRITGINGIGSITDEFTVNT